MKGFEIKFNVYANSQEEADLACSSVKAFISELAQKGIAVSANKITEAVGKWKDNYFVASFFK